jgi:dTDP-4-amino-4,6-dideoxygalactose transaminase
MKEMKRDQTEIPFLRANFPKGLHEDLAEVLDSGYVGTGDWVSAFEHALELYLGAPPVISTSSCTAALTLSYITAGVKQGSVVLSTPMTCAAANIPLLQLGAKIEWLDIDPLSGNVTGESVAEGFKRQPKAQAVVIMDWGGVPCDYAAIVAECRRRGTSLILDAAQSFGSLHEGRRYPHQIDYVCYSFGPTKLFSTVEGGAVVTGEHTVVERIRALRWYGIQRESRDRLRFWEYQVEELGYRFVSNNLFAAVGLRMLSRIEDRLRYHRELAREYDELLSGILGLRLGKRPHGSKPNFWLYTVLVDARESLISKLHSHGIHAATPHQRNDQLLAAWNDVPSSGDLVGVGEFNRKYLCLPIGPWIRLDDVEKICGLIRSGW